MIKVEKAQMSDYLKKNLPDGFYLEEDSDDFLYLGYKGTVVAVFNQKAVSANSIVEEAIKYLKEKGGD